MAAVILIIQLLIPFALASTANSKLRGYYDCAKLLSNENALNYAIPMISVGDGGEVNRTLPLNNQTLYTAYSNGIFPWGTFGCAGRWCTPLQRGVLDFKDLNVWSGDRKEIRRTKYTVTEDKDFTAVIRGCAEAKRTHLENGQLVEDSPWMSPILQRAYIDFHRAGYAHSVEVWDGETLVGGLYYTLVNGVPTGESMFRLPGHPTAQKVALAYLIDKLQAQGFGFIDIQQYRPGSLLAKWGGKTVTRAEFVHDYLHPAQERFRYQ